MSKDVAYFPLTHPQKQIWYTEKVYPSTSIGNIAGTLLFEDKVDFALLERAIKQVFNNNDCLCLRVVEVTGEPKQYIYDNDELQIHYIDVKNINQLNEWEQEQSRTPKKIVDSALYYFAIIRFPDNKGGFYINNHHLINDAWTITLLVSQIVECYSSLKNGNDIIFEKKPSYIEYILGEQEYKKSKRFEKDKKYWEHKFATVPEFITLKSRKSFSDIRANRITFKIPSRLTSNIYQFCQSTQTSVFTLFMAGLSTYISRITSKEDIVLGTHILNRTNAREKNTIGMFISTVPLRLNADLNLPFLDYLQVVARETLSVLKHQKYPYELLLKDFRQKHKVQDSLYDVSLSYQNAKYSNSSNVEKYKSRWHFDGYATNSLTIHIDDRESEGQLEVNYDYFVDLFQEGEIERIHTHLINLLNDSIHNSNKALCDLELLSETEKYQLLYEFNNTQVDYPRDKTIHQLFEEQVERTPDNVAIKFEDTQLTYRELNEKSNQLARVLRDKGVKSDTLVGLMVNRSLEMIVGILGVLKAGGAYLPIDPEYPQNRIEFMLEDSNTTILLSQSHLKGKVGFKGEMIYLDNEGLYQGEHSNQLNVAEPKNLAYVIYTSGSTGQPKGVMIEHRNVVNFIKGITDEINFSPNKTILSVTTISFDIFVLETLLPLSLGLKIVIANEEEQRTPRLFNDLIKNQRVDMIQTTPSRMQLMMIDENCIDGLKGLSEIMLGGEAFPQNLLDLLRKHTKAKIYNMYGPTETTVWSTLKDVSISYSVDIGKPIANTQVYILDKHLNPVPVGTPGELYIAGDGVVRGYLNRPKLTDEKLIDNPFCVGKKMYKAGDLAKYLSTGDVEFLGRSDYQVKIRGFRIELGEIENVLLRHEFIKEAVVIDREDKNQRKYLCAYLVLSESVSISELRNHLSNQLPYYMIPSHFVFLDKIPLTPNGKVNRKALPEPKDLIETGSKYVPPSNEIEKTVAQLFEEILEIKRVSMTDDFFELGGDSLNATELAVALSDKFKIDFPIQEIYSLRTVSEIASVVVRMDKSEYSNKSELVTMLKKGSKDKNIFFIHPGNGEISGYVNFCTAMENDYTCWGIMLPRLKNVVPLEVTVEILASEYVKIIKEIQPSGIYNLFGFCVGGNISYEIARQLLSANEEVGKLLIVASIAPGKRTDDVIFSPETERFFISLLLDDEELNRKLEQKTDMSHIWETTLQHMKYKTYDTDLLKFKLSQIISGIDLPKAIPDWNNSKAENLLYYANVIRSLAWSGVRYKPDCSLDINAQIVTPLQDKVLEDLNENTNIWRKRFKGYLENYEVDGEHFTLFDPEGISQLLIFFDKVFN